jgi:hypothetical protein
MNGMIELSESKLREMLGNAVESAVYMTLNKLGIGKDLVSRSELCRRFGKRGVDKAIKKGYITPRKFKDGSRILYSVSEFSKQNIL